MGIYSHNKVQDPLSGQTYDIRGYDNATQAQIAFNTNQANYDLAAKQNQWNFEQWQRENEYNSPQHQLDLLAKAGINPNAYVPQGMQAAQLQSADLSVAGTPQLTPNSDADRINTIIQGVGGVSDAMLNTLNSIYNAENLKAGIAESKQRQVLADQMNPLLVEGKKSENRILGEHEIQERYHSKQEYERTLQESERTKQVTAETKYYEKKILEDLKLTKNNRILAGRKAQQALSEIAQIDVSTDIQKWTRDFMRRTGIDPHSDWVSQLIQLMLSEPGHAKQVINSLVSNFKEILNTSTDGFSNPFKKNFKTNGYGISDTHGGTGSW